MNVNESDATHMLYHYDIQREAHPRHDCGNRLGNKNNYVLIYESVGLEPRFLSLSGLNINFYVKWRIVPLPPVTEPGGLADNTTMIDVVNERKSSHVPSHHSHAGPDGLADSGSSCSQLSILWRCLSMPMDWLAKSS